MDLNTFLKEAGCYHCGGKIGGTGRPIVIVPGKKHGDIKTYHLECLLIHGEKSG